VPFFMHCQSLYRDSRIQEVPLEKLSSLFLHPNERFKWKVLPTMRDQGMYYPLAVCKITEDLFAKQFWGSPKQDPTVNEDGLVWAIKMGSNRYDAAMHLGYTSIDVIVHPNLNDCVTWDRYFQYINPLFNKDPEPYRGKFSYD